MFKVIDSLAKLFKSIKFKENESKFVYFIDTDNIWTESGGNILGNLTPDYRTFLHCGLNEMTYRTPSNKFEIDRNAVVSIIIDFINNILKNINNINSEQHNWFLRMIDKPADTFCEAIQRILFINMLMWQTNHRLIGLGRWDVMLGSFYDKDIANGTTTKEDAFNTICDVLRLLHKDYKFKSNLLLGDTGQIITVGGSTASGEYFSNDLTEIIIEAVNEVAQPNPKVLLRVNKNTDQKIFEYAINCISSGCGSPLISNDEVIIPTLVNFGIPVEDAVDYSVSACWEPLIAGKDSSLNNATTLNFLRSLNNLFLRDNLEKIKNFEYFKERYLLYLSRNLNAIKRVVSLQRFQYDPVLSLFIRGCYENSCDVSHGGAVYHDVGITSVALANTINALINIKEFVYEKHEFTLDEVKRILVSNFNGVNELKERLKKREYKYGSDNPEIIALANEIIQFVTSQTVDYRNCFGGRLKFGLSAPSYIDLAKGFPASFDGRVKDEPFVVHISNESVNSYTAIMNFAGALDYGGNRFNGNVVDLMTTPSFIIENKSKFIDFIMIAIKVGFFQMQMNVVSSDTLIAAKKKPENFPNLIVRVWGFSAYMIDLPEDYQDLLIARALENEKRGKRT